MAGPVRLRTVATSGPSSRCLEQNGSPRTLCSAQLAQVALDGRNVERTHLVPSSASSEMNGETDYAERAGLHHGTTKMTTT